MSSVTYNANYSALTVRGAQGLAIWYDVDKAGQVGLDAAGDHDVTDARVAQADDILWHERLTVRRELAEINAEICALEAERSRAWKRLGLLDTILGTDEDERAYRAQTEAFGQ